MDFSKKGVTEQVDGASRAHVQRSDKGSTARHIPGPGAQLRPPPRCAQYVPFLYFSFTHAPFGVTLGKNVSALTVTGNPLWLARWAL